MESPPKKSRLKIAIPMLIVLAVVCSGTVPMIGIVAAIAIPNFVAMQYRAKRAEVPANVDIIKTAELAHEAAFGTFIGQEELVPRSEWELGKEPVSWKAGTGFDTLAWAPDGMVRGSYRVEITDGGADFIVHGLCDVDGDGTLAHYTATRTTNAVLIAPNHVY
ncbi:MAG: type II secretory pathway pseudopilin PulG [Myxococcota bacterium]|jgi:type II secretory pathway pseudopilin PulG